jgi:hypothetical protein
MNKASFENGIKRLEELYRNYLWADKIVDAWENDPVYESSDHDKAVEKRDAAKELLDQFTQEMENLYPEYKFIFEGYLGGFSANPVRVKATKRNNSS